MTAVMRPRGDFVREQPTTNHKEFDAQYADIVHALGDRKRRVPRLAWQGLVNPRGDHGRREDAVAVRILGDRERRARAIARSHDDHPEVDLDLKRPLERTTHPRPT